MKIRGKQLLVKTAALILVINARSSLGAASAAVLFHAVKTEKKRFLPIITYLQQQCEICQTI